jgi:predicted Zn-dependent protease
MNKTFFLVIFGIAFMLQPVITMGQIERGPLNAGENSNDVFSNMDRIFNEAEYIPTPEDEYYLGRAVAANILTQYIPYTANPALTMYLNHICQALVINSSMAFAYNGYYVMILDSQEYNAFATPGGHIFLTKGLVEAAVSEDALAAIIAHELAHIMLKHGMQMIDEMKLETEIDGMSQQAAAIAGNTNQNVLNFRNSVSEYFYIMVRNGYSQPQEFEADTAAIIILAATGYSPRGLLEMLRTLQRVQSRQSGGFNNTHPTPTERIANVEKQLSIYRLPDTSSVRMERFNYIMRHD